MELTGAAAGLWLAVAISGLYHGLNPGMGWPLAVSAALMERRDGALWRAIGLLGLGHLLAMLLVLAPFSMVSALVAHEAAIRTVGALLVVTFGGYLLVTRRHPRFLARIPPSRLVLWSFLVAVVHGAALMLIPIYLGLCGLEDLGTGDRAALLLLSRNAGLLLAVALLHTAAMLAVGAAMAVATYRWLGLGVLRSSWFDLETAWALSLVLVGGLGLAAAL